MQDLSKTLENLQQQSKQASEDKGVIDNIMGTLGISQDGFLGKLGSSAAKTFDRLQDEIRTKQDRQSKILEEYEMNSQKLASLEQVSKQFDLEEYFGKSDASIRAGDISRLA